MGGFDGEKSVECHCDWSERSPSITVVEAISTLENTKLADIPVVLYDYVNPEALDMLVTNDSDITVSFHLDRYQVRIEGNRLNVTSTDN